MRLAIIGAGVAGLAAAYEATRHDGVDAVVFEAADRIGGKIIASSFAGKMVDEAADAFLARVPWAVELCDELGLTPRLTQPAARTAFVWSRGELRRLPASQLLGIPTDLDELADSGIVSYAGVERARADLDRRGPAPSGDPTIGALIRDRLGDEVLERLVAPLVGGINAGDVDRLSLRACAAQIAAAADHGDSILDAAAGIRGRASNAPDAPVFHAPLGGMAELVDRLAEELDPVVEIRTSTPVRSIRSKGPGWIVGDDPIVFDAVVVATPAPIASRLVESSPPAGDFLAGIDHASVVLVTLAFDSETIEHPLDGSGFLVPAAESRFVTACSFSSTKWQHLSSPDQVIMRVSVGRDGDERAATDIDDQALLAAVLGDLDDFIGLGSAPTQTRISRWPDALPQYRPGHLEAVGDFEAAMAAEMPGVVVTGAALRGLGVPACIQQGRTAVRTLLGR